MLSVLDFCLVCINTALQGLIGFVMILFLTWLLLKIFRPSPKKTGGNGFSR